MKNRHILSILTIIWVIANSLDPRPCEVWVNIEADNMSADSAEASYQIMDGSFSTNQISVVFSCLVSPVLMQAPFHALVTQWTYNPE